VEFNSLKYDLGGKTPSGNWTQRDQLQPDCTDLCNQSTVCKDNR